MKLFSFMESHSQNCQPEHAEFALTMRQELMDYFRTTSLEYDSDTLAWYKSHTSDFSHVARAVRTVLSIPASSAPVERIFSTTGKIFRPERSRLKTEKFEQLVFIKCNKRLHWQSCMNIEQWQWPLRQTLFIVYEFWLIIHIKIIVIVCDNYVIVIVGLIGLTVIVIASVMVKICCNCNSVVIRKNVIDPSTHSCLTACKFVTVTDTRSSHRCISVWGISRNEWTARYNTSVYWTTGDCS